MLIRSGERGLASTAAEVAVLLGERGIGGQDVDVEQRLRRWRTERGPKAEAARAMAKRWTGLAPKPVEQEVWDHAAGVCLALAYPDRVARRRDGTGENWASVGGQGLPARSRLGAGQFGMAGGGRDTRRGLGRAHPVGCAARPHHRRGAVRRPDRDAAYRHLQPRDRRCRGVARTAAGGLRLSSGPDSGASADAIAEALVEGVRAHGLSLLPWSDGAGAYRARAAYAGVALDDETLLERLDDWLPALVAGKRRLDALAPGALTEAIRNLVDWNDQRRIDSMAPSHFTSPAGSSHAIDYASEGGPRVELRVQALFGLAEHPVIGTERVPLVLSLTSPAGRPIQTTRDLPGFWAGSWSAVAKEMRGRYPRHPWPDDPAAASATLRTKKADARAAGSR